MHPLYLVNNTMFLQTQLFLNATEGLDAHTLTRPNEWTNHLSWLAGHLVSTRYMLLGMLGHPMEEPHPELFAQGKSISNDLTYPSLAQCREDWQLVSEALAVALKEATPEILNGKAAFPTPIGDTVRDAIAFFGHHEGYHIGQIGILRKFFGLEAMKYS